MHGVANVGGGPVVLLVKKGLPATSFEEFLQLSRDNPGKPSYASTGIGTENHFAGELLKHSAKVGAWAFMLTPERKFSTEAAASAIARMPGLEIDDSWQQLAIIQAGFQSASALRLNPGVSVAEAMQD